MKKAAELLRDPLYRTYEISEMVGYSNPKNFTRTFKSYFGKTPKEYRNYHEPLPVNDRIRKGPADEKD
jgi:Response regulator containing CheY-like receiver domain and AraC-type DNA-binding domain